VHATNHLKVLELIRSSADNLQAAIDGETYEVEEMYPAFKAVAELQKETGGQRSTRWALEAEKVHAGMYQRAKQAVINGEDIQIGTIYICQKCGYTVEGKAPERCPICGAPAEEFRAF
jgi:rubrerythrin